MTDVQIRSVTKRFGRTIAVDDVSLDIASGEFVCLLGASGCGKTTLLRILGGFAEPDAGTVLADGKRVDRLPPSKREVGFVFQSYALFPTKTVAENIGFGLALRRQTRAEISRRVAELCELTRLTGLEGRYAHELSGGQQQRVALARALAPAPTMLLLDEPLSALDAKIRVHLRTEIRGIVDRLKVTTVYVTHDQEEALSIADRVAVMDAGRILQIDTPMTVYLRPNRRFVADFVGTSNALPAEVKDGRITVHGLPLDSECPAALSGRPSILASIRPEHVIVSPADVPGIGGRLLGYSFGGATVRARIALPGGGELLADIPTHAWQEQRFAVGAPVAWRVRPGAAVLLPADEG